MRPDLTKKVVLGSIAITEMAVHHRYMKMDEHDTLVDCAQELGSHLVENEVLTIEEVGWEKMRYLVGVAYYYNHKGEAMLLSA